MDRLKALWPPTHAYKEVRTSQSDDDEPQSEGSEENLREQIATLESNVWCLRVSLLITVVALMPVTVLAVFDRVTSVRDAHRCGHIGSDHSGFVPPGRWTIFDKSSPYYIEEDTFYDLNKTKMVVKKLKSLHNSSNVLVNDNWADWHKPDGTVAKLPAYYSTVSYRQTYIIRSFHQMHCLWAPQHVAHCLNTIREAIMCLADASPMTYVNGFAVGHVTDDQKFMRRDWSALRKWANDPVRGVRYKNLAPEGAKHDNYTEIIPFPKLTPDEEIGLA
ncbi:Cyclochlorotine biosynthesis protein R [Colletotrichum viniferum]|nr:Cyclochlorotine biosynthesis protein R [Colletotrichum viniferum]